MKIKFDKQSTYLTDKELHNLPAGSFLTNDDGDLFIVTDVAVWFVIDLATGESYTTETIGTKRVRQIEIKELIVK